MSSFVWMKVLESTPERYDRGIALLSGGRIAEVHDRIAELVAEPGARVLDVGCGTGGVSLACAARGAEVTGIDLDAGMLEVARRKAEGRPGAPSFVQASAAELEDHFAEGSFDAVVSCLTFSELSVEEQRYALRTIRARLRPGGALVLADEVQPTEPLRRLTYRLRRLPRAALTYLLTQTTTRPVEGIEGRVRDADFEVVEVERLWSDAFLILHARRPEGP